MEGLRLTSAAAGRGDRLRDDRVRLTPEEESLPDGDDDEFDDTLPADLWFRSGGGRRANRGGTSRPH